MPLTPYKIERFGGLDLVLDAQEGGPSRCLDMLDVELPLGRVTPRAGTDVFTTVTGTNRYRSLFPFDTTAGANQLAALTESGANGTPAISVLNTSGAIVASHNFTAAGLPFFNAARFGDATNAYMYFADGTTTVVRWDGAAFSTPASMPEARFLAVQANDNRLVATVDSGTFSRVQFSDAGAPETFGADNYVELTPGDGEVLSGLASWGNALFAFKQSKFAVFYGNSTDTTGGPIFNYRMVDTGVGVPAVTGSGQSVPVISARPGVFFMNYRGIYLTQGGEPRLISRAIDPLFTGDLPDVYSGSRISAASIGLAQMAWVDERLYVAVPSNGFNDRLLVWDSIKDEWLIWSIAANGLAAYATADREKLFFSYSTGDNEVAYVDSSLSTDNGLSISWSWRSGWYDLSGRDLEASTRHSKLRGTGTVSHELFNDYSTTSWSGAQSVTLGTAPAVDEGWSLAQGHGTMFSDKLSSTGSDAVHSLTHYISFIRESG